jgi:xylan 1,4-beta-xylosidase
MTNKTLHIQAFAVQPGRRRVLKGAALAMLAPAGQRTTAIRSLQGLDGPPVPATLGASNIPAGATAVANIDNPNGLDRTALFQQMGVDFVRTHDLDAFGTGDLDGRGANRIFPDWSADATLEASYDFTALDTIVAGIRAQGSEVFFRLGRSDLTMIGVDNDNTPPSDFDKFALVAQHIVKHYNQGWANGFYYDIGYWEIWNEPDLTPFWTGTAAQYYSLYEKVAAAVKAVDATLKVGGPVLATHNDDRGTMNSFLAYVQANALPLDFFSFHWYPQYVDPLDFYRLGVEYRALLDSYGFTAAELHLNEWNYYLYGTPTEDVHAAFVATSLIYMHEAPIDRACCYARTLPLIDDAGALTKGGRAFEAIGTLTGLLQVPTTGQDHAGFGVLAGCAADNSQVRVVISNHEIPAADMGPFTDGNDLVIPGVLTLTFLDRQTITYADNAGYSIQLAGLPWSGDSVVRRYRVDASNDLALVETLDRSGTAFRVSAALAAPGVELRVVPRRAWAQAARPTGRPPPRPPIPRGAGIRASAGIPAPAGPAPAH